MKNKPEWWPENPYFESAMATIKSDRDYVKAIPDPHLRTAVSWYLGNRFWELASKMIFEAVINNLDDSNDNIELRQVDRPKVEVESFKTPNDAWVMELRQ